MAKLPAALRSSYKPCLNLNPGGLALETTAGGLPGMGRALLLLKAKPNPTPLGPQGSTLTYSRPQTLGHQEEAETAQQSQMPSCHRVLAPYSFPASLSFVQEPCRCGTSLGSGHGQMWVGRQPL